ncbi:MAG: helix-turn-helix domain-containing protein, partial [Clostridia bacterium]|nr:helix-turn-helix domain-containing protein [Clostridia bacterium]
GSFMDISKSYSDAMTALKVSKIFDGDADISRYDKLGLGRLIYQLPKPLCEMFIREVFPNDAFRQLDEETRTTIDTFFANDLNGSETSRELFVHRNTLVYRLEKIKKFTGLDLREFDDAIVFKVALMVKKYLDSSPTKF